MAALLDAPLPTHHDIAHTGVVAGEDPRVEELLRPLVPEGAMLGVQHHEVGATPRGDAPAVDAVGMGSALRCLEVQSLAGRGVALVREHRASAAREPLSVFEQAQL